MLRSLAFRALNRQHKTCFFRKCLLKTLATRRQHGHETTQKTCGRIFALRLIVFVADAAWAGPSIFHCHHDHCAHAHLRAKLSLRSFNFCTWKGVYLWCFFCNYEIKSDQSTLFERHNPKNTDVECCGLNAARWLHEAHGPFNLAQLDWNISAEQTYCLLYQKRNHSIS